jgi:hypothetical protein
MVAAAMGEVDFTCIANQVARNIGSCASQPSHQHDLARVHLRAGIVVSLEWITGSSTSVPTA